MSRLVNIQRSYLNNFMKAFKVETDLESVESFDILEGNFNMKLVTSYIKYMEGIIGEDFRDFRDLMARVKLMKVLPFHRDILEGIFVVINNITFTEDVIKVGKHDRISLSEEQTLRMETFFYDLFTLHEDLLGKSL
jgi:hypothetical protein